MDPIFQSFLNGFPTLLLHFSVTLGMLGAGIWIYQLITPWHEMRLIRAGNLAAATSFSGAILGLAIPLAFCMATSVGVLDIIIWGFVALVIQLLTFRLADILLRGLPKRIEDGEIGAAILVVAVKLSVALINAAAIAG
jgi:putative membrane protein|tara:strand:+ start:178 stop:591 length:414 start_codon:yes stop_codon:yes gene_type:complete